MILTNQDIQAMLDRVEKLEATHPEDLKNVARDVTNIFVKLAEQYERIVALESQLNSAVDHIITLENVLKHEIRASSRK